MIYTAERTHPARVTRLDATYELLERVQNEPGRLDGDAQWQAEVERFKEKIAFIKEGQRARRAQRRTATA